MTGASIGSFLLLASAIFAHADTLTATSCDSLFNLPTGTISTASSAQYLNPTTCAAYQDLIKRYNPGTCSAVGFSNAKVQGITSLNPTFAVNLDNMLKAGDAAGYHMMINSAFRSVAGEQCANPHGFGGNYSLSMHTKGLAADLQFPNDPNSRGGCDVGENSAAYLWVQQNDSTYHLGPYDQLHGHVNNECNHVEAISGSTSGGIGPGGGATSNTGMPQSTTAPAPYTTPGLGSTQAPVPGQIMNQDYYCMISANPIVTVSVPAGTPFPSGCLNGAQSSSILQPYCSGNTIVYNYNGITTTGQACPFGCSNGACTQQCPAGYISQNGQCSPTAQSTQPIGTGSSGSSPVSNGSSGQTSQTSGTSGSTQSSSGTTGSSQTQTSGTTPTVNTSTITAPHLIANTGSSSQSFINSLLNPQITGATTTTPTSSTGTSVQNLLNSLMNPEITPGTSATTSPASITLGTAGSNITQTEPTTIPGVTVATPTSLYFQSGTIANGSNGNTNGNSGALPSADTFVSNNLSNTPVGSVTPTTQNTFTSNALSILAGLKADLIGALQFLGSFINHQSSNPAPSSTPLGQQQIQPQLQQGGE